MSKIVKLFKTPQDNVVEAIEYMLKMAKEGEITSYVFACNCADGNVATSHSNADFGMRATLISHLQCDLSYAMIEANMDRLVEKL